MELGHPEHSRQDLQLSVGRKRVPIDSFRVNTRRRSLVRRGRNVGGVQTCYLSGLPDVTGHYRYVAAPPAGRVIRSGVLLPQSVRHPNMHLIPGIPKKVAAAAAPPTQEVTMDSKPRLPPPPRGPPSSSISATLLSASHSLTVPKDSSPANTSGATHIMTMRAISWTTPA